MINILFLLIIIALGIFIKLFTPVDIFNNATYALGILMLGGFVSGNLAKKIKFPSVTGYILIGIIIGPFGLQLITRSNVADLQLLNSLALSIIALTAGGEIKFSGLKKNLRTINNILIFQTVYIILGIMLAVVVLGRVVPFFRGLDPNSLLVAGLLIGIVATASSPATTLAVIVESGKKNRYTDLILSIVMLKDIVILFFFVVGLSFSRSLIGSTGFDSQKILTVFLEITGSILSGILVGAVIVAYMKFIKKDNIIFILALSFFAYEIFEPLHLHPLLVMMIAGFIVENFSQEGDKLMESLKSISPPVYIIFFTLAGATINLDYLQSFWVLALVIVIFRVILKQLGTMTGGMAAKEGTYVKKYLGMAFISQAGLSLGMATIIEKSFTGFGQRIAVLIISVIVINQVIGPLLLKFSLDKSD